VRQCTTRGGRQYETDRVPDHYLHETDEWTELPHSLEGLTDEAIASNRPAIDAILRGVC